MRDGDERDWAALQSRIRRASPGTEDEVTEKLNEIVRQAERLAAGTKQVTDALAARRTRPKLRIAKP